MANASVEAFKRRLARIPERARKAGFDAVLQGAREIAGKMQAAVPRDKGALAKSIRLETDRANVRVTIKAGGPMTTRPVRQGASAQYDYALGQEYGNQQNPAQPFFWPTWRLLKPSVRRKVNKAVKTAIEQEFGR